MIYNVNNFDYSIISKSQNQRRKKGNQGKRNNKRVYKDLICAFDIETTNDRESVQAFMYIWQFQIDNITIMGRTWNEFIILLQRMSEQLNRDQYIVIFVHNLSFEFQFLRGIYDFTKEEVFAVDSRKVLKCEMFNHFELRCSYLQTNMSLNEFTHKMGVQDVKLSGDDFDYSKARYPWTPLTDLELQYCVNDVKGLVEAMRIQMDLEHDTFYTLPLTSTGYVRRDVKAAMRHYNRQDLKDMLPDYNVFCMLREAFRGGNTHANRYYANYILHDVHSNDYASSYPNVQINCRFPMSAWIREDGMNLDRCLLKIYKHKRACLMRVKLFDVKLKDPMWGAPYLAKAKCRNIKNCENDNGRVLSAEYLETTLTDIDFKIVLDEYEFSWIEFTDFYHCRYGLLPKQLRETVLEYFRRKTELKGVKGEELYYMKSKNKLNSVYGMSVQSPVKQSIDFEHDFILRDDDETELLNAANKKAFMSYAWGVWTTAHARAELEEAIKMCGDRFVYCDTDSVKYLGSIDFDSFNAKKRRRSEENGAVAVDPAGVKHYLGVMEHDADYSEFATMGAKKYAYRYPDGKLGITIAGVNKSKGADELEAAGGLSAFKEGFVFKKAGGTESIYNDIPSIDHIIREGREIPITSNLYIKDSEYTLGITGEYYRILQHANVWREIFLKKW